MNPAKNPSITRNVKTLALILAGLPVCSVSAETSFVFVGQLGQAGTDISADGSIIVGNDISAGYEAFRWQEDTFTVTNLGRASAPAVGVSAGTPKVSLDGNFVSSTIVSDDGMFSAMGVWDQVNGTWTEALPLPPDAGEVDFFRSSAFGLSGDGSKVTGLYWHPNSGSGTATAMAYDHVTNTSLEVTDWESSNTDGRANAANFDGSVLGGWQSDNTGAWQATVWEDGIGVRVTESSASTQVYGLTDDGTIAVGAGLDESNPFFLSRRAAVWRKQADGSYSEQLLPALPETPIGFSGNVFANDVNADGTIVVGENRFAENGPFSDGTGFIWTQKTGMVDLVQFLMDEGVVVSENLDIRSISAISADGRHLLGQGRLDVGGGVPAFITFRITTDFFVDAVEHTLLGDANCDGFVNLLDLDILGTNWQSTNATFAEADFNNDGNVDLLDLDILGQNWGASPEAFAAALAASGIAVPEPASLITILVLAGAAGHRRGRRSI